MTDAQLNEAATARGEKKIPSVGLPKVQTLHVAHVLAYILHV